MYLGFNWSEKRELKLILFCKTAEHLRVRPFTPKSEKMNFVISGPQKPLQPFFSHLDEFVRTR